MSKENNMINKALYWFGYHRADIRQRLADGPLRPYVKGRNAAWAVHFPEMAEGLLKDD